MRPSPPRFVGLVPVVLALGCGSGGESGYSLDVGTDDGGSSLVLPAGDAPFNVLSSGVGYQGSGLGSGVLSATDGGVTGTEGNGVIEIVGTF